MSITVRINNVQSRGNARTAGAPNPPDPKQEDNRYSIIKKNVADAAGSVLGAAASTIAGAVGVDPVASGLAAIQGASDYYNSLGDFQDLFSGVAGSVLYKIFQCTAAPLLDGLRLVNDFKLTQFKNQELRHADPRNAKLSGWRLALKSGQLGSVLVDGAHVAMDVAAAAGIAGAAIGFPPLVAALPLLLKGSVIGHILAGAAHGIGLTQIIVDDPGESLAGKWSHGLKQYLKENGLKSQIRRVFLNEEPLAEEAEKG